MIVCLDANIFIYALNEFGETGRLSVELLGRIERGELLGVSSTLSILETLVKPWSISSEGGKQAQLAMEGMDGVDYIPLDTEVAILAAQLRANNWKKLSLQDSIHLASALRVRADVFVTNDKDLVKMRVGKLRIRLLGEPLE